MNFFNNNGIRTIDFNLPGVNVEKLRRHWKEFAKSIDPCPDCFDGCGIVICAGGVSYYTCCLILIKTLRDTGCKLPVEVWYLGSEISYEAKSIIESYGASCHNFYDYYDNAPLSTGYILKPLSILYSHFKEVLYLDADNICSRDPEFLFQTDEYNKYGAIFWPDYWETSADNPIWEITDVKYRVMKEQESGQLLVNKERCWKELNLCLYFNKMSKVYYQLLLGDKDTFRFAWLALKTPFYMIKDEPATCGYLDKNHVFSGITMVQHAPNRQMCFLHRNLLKWDLTKSGEKNWRLIKRFKKEAQIKEYLVRKSLNGHFQMDLRGQTEQLHFIEYFGDLENRCLQYLDEIRSSSQYLNFLIYSHIVKNRI